MPMRQHTDSKPKMRLTILVALGLLLPALASATATITVDFSQTCGPVTYRASGLLHSVSTSTLTDEIIKPVVPRLFRGDISEVPRLYNRLTSVGVTYKQSVLSDYYYEGPIPGDDNNWNDWENRCASEATRDKNSGRQIQYDVWNEPDGGYFWPRSLDQFKETWRRGVVKLRAANPNAVIVGPSISGWSASWITDFLTYCKSNYVLPNALSWHELGGSPAGIVAHTNTARQIITNLDVGGTVTLFSINELVPYANHTAPGQALAFLGGVERASAQGAPAIQSAALSVWEDGYILDGMLDQSGNRRSLWYAYKFYGDLKGVMISCPGAVPYDGVASYDAGATSNAGASSGLVALGEYQGTTETLSINFSNLPADLTPGGQVHVRVSRIANSAASASSGPVTQMDANFSVSGNAFTLSLPSPGAYGAYAIQLTPVVYASAQRRIWGSFK